MHSLVKKLLDEAPVLTDGAWGTQLQARGLGLGDCADVWNLSHPDRVEDLARAYVEAGSRIILTNTFRANRVALAAHGLADRLAEINQAGVRLSRKAAGESALVFASLGPVGHYPTSGEVYYEQATVLAGAGADGLVLETMTDLDEALQALAAAQTTGLPVVVSLVFDWGSDHDRLRTGETPEQAALALTHAGADVLGANCGRGIAGSVSLCHRLRAATELPIWIKPNAGLPEMKEGRFHYPTTAEEFAGRARELRAAGASFLGGCCGTTPEFIRALRTALF